MNTFFIQSGLQGLKPFLTALCLPPTAFLLIMGLASVTLRRQRGAGTVIVASGLAAIWLSCSLGVAQLLAPALLSLSRPLDAVAIDEMRRHAREPVAIIVLGGGVEQSAPEYGGSSLQFRSLERLRYGVWLSRQTGWAVGFTGGVGWGQSANVTVSEADVAQRIATRELGRPLRWAESLSRDTRENAENTARLLRLDGIRRIVLVTHSDHMPRAIRNFERAVGPSILVMGAPIGLAEDAGSPILRWMPSGEGLYKTRGILREWLGTMSGA